MEYIYSVEEATQKLYAELTEATGFKYLKSQQCLKKTVKDLVFEIQFFTSKWNQSHERVEVNAEFRLWCKRYGKLPVDNVIASIAYQPKQSFSDEGIQSTAVMLCARYEEDYNAATEELFREHFDEYNVYLDFIADTLGISVIKEKAQELYDNLSEEMKRQAADYKNGARDRMWMINRGNLKYIIDNDLVRL